MEALPYNPAGIQKLAENKQSQTVSGGAQAIQASGDVVIHQGMSLEQMASIMREITTITERYTAEAMHTVQSRITEFQETVLRHFAVPEGGDREAFRDPDFQHTLIDAQRAYSRSGDKQIRETLADIIVRRSRVESTSRLALTLNDAAVRAAKLTCTEFSILSLVYIARYTRHNFIRSVADFSRLINDNYIPFVKDIPEKDAPYWHVEAQSCGRLSMAEVNLRQTLLKGYGGIIGKGITLEQAKNACSEEGKINIEQSLVPCLRNKDMVQPAATNSEAYLRSFSAVASQGDLASVWNLFETSIPGDEELFAMLEETSPGVTELFQKWKKTPISRLELNSVGIAIGHANAAQCISFDAALDIWID